MRRTFVLLFLIALVAGFLVWPTPPRFYWSCVSGQPSIHGSLEETVLEADAIFLGTPHPELKPGIIPFRVVVESVLQGNAQHVQDVGYARNCATFPDQRIFLEAPSSTDLGRTTLFVRDWKGTTSLTVYHYPATDENLAIVNQFVDSEPKEPLAGPIYWSTVPSTVYATVALGVLSLLGICGTTIRPKPEDQEPLDDEETRPLIEA